MTDERVAIRKKTKGQISVSGGQNQTYYSERKDNRKFTLDTQIPKLRQTRDITSKSTSNVLSYEALQSSETNYVITVNGCRGS